MQVTGARWSDARARYRGVAALPVEAVLGLIVVAVVANLLLMAALIAPVLRGPRPASKRASGRVETGDTRVTEAAVVSGLDRRPDRP